MKDDRSHLGRDAEHFERYRAPTNSGFVLSLTFMVATLLVIAATVIGLQLVGVL